MSDAVDAFEQRMYAAVPALRAEMETYRRSYGDEYAEQGLDSPGLDGFLLDLALDSGQRTLQGSREDVATMRRLFDFLDSELGHDAEVDELIVRMFAENLPAPDGIYAQALDQVGPKVLAARLRKFQADQQSVPASTVAFLHRLGAAVPGLQSRVAGHIEYHDGRPLPHAFMGEIVFDAVELVASGRDQVVRPLLDFLESEYGVDEDIDNVIDVSFIEMLPDPGERGSEIEQLLGPKLRAELDRQRNWSEPPPAG